MRVYDFIPSFKDYQFTDHSLKPDFPIKYVSCEWTYSINCCHWIVQHLNNKIANDWNDSILLGQLQVNEIWLINITYFYCPKQFDPDINILYMPFRKQFSAKLWGLDKVPIWSYTIIRNYYLINWGDNPHKLESNNHKVQRYSITNLNNFPQPHALMTTVSV